MEDCILRIGVLQYLSGTPKAVNCCLILLPEVTALSNLVETSCHSAASFLTPTPGSFIPIFVSFTAQGLAKPFYFIKQSNSKVSLILFSEDYNFTMKLFIKEQKIVLFFKNISIFIFFNNISLLPLLYPPRSRLGTAWCIIKIKQCLSLCGKD